MAQSFVTDAGTLVIPGAYSQVKVQTASGGIAASGVLMIVGEADAGPRFDQEPDLSVNAFGPNQLADVVGKYKSGPIVDAYRAAIAAPNDPNLQGSPTAVIIAKTNASVKALSATLDPAGAAYCNVEDKSYGALGNLIYFQVKQQTPETAPSTGSFTFIPPVGSCGVDIRINGGAASNFTVAANSTPSAFVTQLNAVTGITATGGVNRGLLTVAGSLTLATNPGGAGVTVIQLTWTQNWAVAPVVGDTLIIPTGSIVAGAGGQNIGAYVITSVAAASLIATKLSDAGHGGAVAGVITNPLAVVSTPVVANTEAQAWSPITALVTASTVIDGIGKSLEIAQLVSGTDLLSRTAYQLATTTPVTWVSKTGAPALLTSSSEYSIDFNTNRQVDSITEDIVVGGQLGMMVSYTGTTGVMTITPTALTTTVTGGAGGNLSINLTQFPTIADLVNYINAQPGYSATVGSGVIGQYSCGALDDVLAAGICSDFGALNCRVKVDAFKFYNAVQGGSVLVQVNQPASQPLRGLPAVNATPVYLAGGARGGSANADFTAAMDALQNVSGNFLIPLVSADATVDIANGVTDSTSTYTIDAINAYAKTHVLLMSTLKKRKNRQAFVSKETSFVNAQAAAANLASFRVAMCFEDFKQNNTSGNLQQFQPWMGAILAAGMQAAGFYRAIVHKGINTSGVLSLDGSFNPNNDSQMEVALQAGLLPAKKAPGGGYYWVSDQTTYGKDNNFVFNSIQAVYAADIVALSTAQAMERAFVGQSVADVSAAVALSFLEAQMATFLRLKLIAPSDDAPKGFKNASIRISGGALIVAVEIKLAGAIYFIPISFLVSPVVQAANG